MPNTRPFCSVIVLNYNGALVLEQNLQALFEQEYPKSLFEIIVVDNCSQDTSREILEQYRKKYPQLLKPLYLDKNYGFGEGNNRGVLAAQGKYVALLNNDCVADSTWLSTLVSSAQKDEKIFAVTSKVLLFNQYVTIQLPLSRETNILGVSVVASNVLRFSKKASLQIPHAYVVEDDVKWLLIDLPIAADDTAVTISINSNDTGKVDLTGALDRNGIQVESKSTKVVKTDTTKSIEAVIKISNQLKKNAYNKVQNAGIMVFNDGYGRDIGASIQNNTADYEEDAGQFSEDKEVYAACGCAVLYKRSIFLKLGMFCNAFFMYYEDVELSELARLHGYRIVYSPTSVVRHLHAMSSEENSPFFMFHAEKGRLLHVLMHFPLYIFFKEYLLFFMRFLGFSMRLLFRPQHLTFALAKFLVLSNIGVFLPIYLLKRVDRHKGGSYLKIHQHYANILYGQWYFE